MNNAQKVVALCEELLSTHAKVWETEEAKIAWANRFNPAIILELLEMARAYCDVDEFEYGSDSAHQEYDELMRKIIEG